MYVCSNAVKHFANYKLRKISPGKKVQIWFEVFWKLKELKNVKSFYTHIQTWQRGARKIEKYTAA